MQNSEFEFDAESLEQVMKLVSDEIDEIFFKANTTVPCIKTVNTNVGIDWAMTDFKWGLPLKNPVFEIALMVPDTAADYVEQYIKDHPDKA